MPNYNEKLSEYLSNQLTLELNSAYLYMALEIHCSSRNVSLFGFTKYFKVTKKEELAHAKGIKKHMVIQDLKFMYNPIANPLMTKIKKDITPMQMLELALENEKNEQENIFEIYKLAEENKDYATCTFLDAYVDEQAKSINEIENMMMNLKRCENELGLFLFDQTLLKYKK